MLWLKHSAQGLIYLSSTSLCFSIPLPSRNSASLFLILLFPIRVPTILSYHTKSRPASHQATTDLLWPILLLLSISCPAAGFRSTHTPTQKANILGGSMLRAGSEVLTSAACTKSRELIVGDTSSGCTQLLWIQFSYFALSRVCTNTCIYYGYIFKILLFIYVAIFIISSNVSVYISLCPLWKQDKVQFVSGHHSVFLFSLLPFNMSTFNKRNMSHHLGHIYVIIVVTHQAAQPGEKMATMDNRQPGIVTYLIHPLSVTGAVIMLFHDDSKFVSTASVTNLHFFSIVKEHLCMHRKKLQP